MRVWIDIENPPQVRYLLPCKAWFERTGAEVVVTARDDGATLRMLESEEVEFTAVGRQPGRSPWRKVAGLAARARALVAVFGRRRVDLLLGASRPGALAARYLRLPAFFIGDYEFTNLAVQRFTGTYLLFPDVIDAETFRSRGLRPERLIPFRGLKEDLSFSGMALEEYPPHTFPGVPDDLPRLLFRPPAEQSHYHREESTTLSAELLEFLSRRDAVQVVYAPRYAYQSLELRRHRWRRPPVVLDEPVHFVSLLKGVDLVVSAGGTMLREAAYLGVPAYGIMQSRIGAVDRYLASLGRLEFVSTAADFGSIEPQRGRRLPMLESNPRLPDELLTEITSRVRPARGARGARR
ncbi:MAG TPA: DUF354 domain-containing protein [Gaiellaceae bacterium]|nr:DUF354 domain-containing protein [Gaiellaceae bacterium]